MKKLVLTLLLILLVLPSALAEEPVVERTRQSVVHLYALGYDDAGNVRTRWTGSGFPVGKAGENSDIFLTNWHVVTGSGKFEQDHVRLWILLDEAKMDSTKTPLPEYCIPCETLGTTDGFPDVAVIRAMEPTPGYPALPLMSSRQIADQSPVYALGFPGIAATHNGADSGPEDVAVSQGIIKDRLIMTKAGNTWSLIHTAQIQHGNSGGPLINTEGAVIGLNTYGFEEDVSTDLFCSVFSDYAMELLDSLGIPYDTVQGRHPAVVMAANLLHLPQIPDGAAWVVFAAVVLAAAVFAFFFVKSFFDAVREVREKLKAKKQEEEEP